MLENILFFVHGTLLLLFGVYLSVAFAGIRFSKTNMLHFLGLCALCGALQIVVYVFFAETVVWKLYPLITHLPLILFLCIAYHKRIVTSLASVFTAYLCCQPAKWFGVLITSLTENTAAAQLARICALAAVAFITLKYLASYLSELFNKDTRSVCIFGIIPTVYYIFDYTTVIYTDLWTNNNRIVAEFLPFFLSIIYMLFCFVYYKEYEQKADAERKEQIVRIIVAQQSKEVEAIKRSEHEVKLLRHDMRLFLSSLAVCIEDGDYDKAKDMITSHTSHIDGTKVVHFCKNDTVNYVLSDFVAKCKLKYIDFTYTVEIDEIKTDELLFCSILSNALDNALNAQNDIPADKRSIKLLLKSSEDKLLLSVKNPVAERPVFADGLPITTRDGHGYGTQSIRYMTERLGGNCQFTIQGETFITRIII